MALKNSLNDWNAAGRVKSSDDPCTSGINLVDFCPVILELVRLICVQQALIGTLG